MTGETKQYIVTPEIAYGSLWTLPAWLRIFIFYTVLFLLGNCLFDWKLPSYPELFYAWIVGMCMALFYGFKKDTIVLSDEFIEATDTFNRVRPTRIYKDRLSEVTESYLGVPPLRRRGLVVTSQSRFRSLFVKCIFIPSGLPDYAEIKARLMEWVPLPR
jgi:hypothetical protein